MCRIFGKVAQDCLTPYVTVPDKLLSDSTPELLCFRENVPCVLHNKNTPSLSVTLTWSVESQGFVTELAPNSVASRPLRT